MIKTSTRSTPTEAKNGPSQQVGMFTPVRRSEQTAQSMSDQKITISTRSTPTEAKNGLSPRAILLLLAQRQDQTALSTLSHLMITSTRLTPTAAKNGHLPLLGALVPVQQSDQTELTIQGHLDSTRSTKTEAKNGSSLQAGALIPALRSLKMVQSTLALMMKTYTRSILTAVKNGPRPWVGRLDQVRRLEKMVKYMSGFKNCIRASSKSIPMAVKSGLSQCTGLVPVRPSELTVQSIQGQMIKNSTLSTVAPGVLPAPFGLCFTRTNSIQGSNQRHEPSLVWAVK